MPSEFELLATIVKFDTYWDEQNMEPARDLIDMILRMCHDFNSPKYDATMLADQLGALIGGWMSAVRYPEAEGDGGADWGEWSGGPIPDPFLGRSPEQKPIQRGEVIVIDPKKVPAKPESAE